MGSKLLLGLDIGGANTKAALLIFKNHDFIHSYSYIEYFPFWEKTVHDINLMFVRIIEKVLLKNNFELDDLDYITITITAELSDAFQTKKEGIHLILDALKETFDIEKLRFISTENSYYSLSRAEKNPYKIAAANWVSTALFLGEFVKDCILIDAGSTTIDVIPIKNSIPITIGKTDLTRLMNHELIYTGGLRATIPSITHFVPYRDQKVRISFEKFALISDVHRILGNISEKEYLNDTADNRSKSLKNCYSRLSRIICMDKDLIKKDELDHIANYIYQKQVDIVLNEIRQFMNNLVEREPSFKANSLFVLTGLSADFLIKKALDSLGFRNIKNYEEVVGNPDHISSSAYAVAAAYYYQMKGKDNGE